METDFTSAHRDCRPGKFFILFIYFIFIYLPLPPEFLKFILNPISLQFSIFLVLKKSKINKKKHKKILVAAEKFSARPNQGD